MFFTFYVQLGFTGIRVTDQRQVAHTGTSKSALCTPAVRQICILLIHLILWYLQKRVCAEHGCLWCLESTKVNTSPPVLKDLHWLPLSQRVDFKTALMVWKCVHDQVYLSDLCVPANAISGRQHLRSATTDTLLVTRARTATGQRSFAVYGPAT